ncbi:MAG: hypothetical protein MUF03_02125 [Rubrivivax sp.]|nr:hypothetical protein [Rubrivivax sp.]
MSGPDTAGLVARWPGRVDAATAARWRARLDARPGGSLPLFDAIDPAEVLAAIAPLPELFGAGPLALLVGQCWVRRARPAHHWHQDGALHHDFLAGPPAPPLAMHTCWIPLVDCGADAPGLEWVDVAPQRLLAPAELSDAAVRAAFPASAFRRPRLAAGEALVFDGALLHRSHVTPAMTRTRTSIELRVVPAAPVPPRLVQEPLVAIA